MDASMASYQARLATFEGTTTKSRRTSSRSKKAGAKSKNAWPLAAPSAEDLAYAGFVWKPTSASPDNVQCFACNCQLDGWEESDVPAFEHLTHSPSCGFAVVVNIRLRHGDPGRAEEDPISEQMVAARRDTFADMWPLDPSAGFPSAEQLAAAGWYYDPADGTPDGVTCPYCHLSLDAWDEGDDPLEEHRRRASDCLFFSLAEMYHPPEPEPAPKPAPKKAKRASRASTKSTTKSTKSKRASTRSSTISNATVATTTTTAKKATRSKKRTSEAMEDTVMSEAIEETSKRMRYSSMSSLPDDLPVGTPKKMPSEMETEHFTMSSFPASLPVGTPKKMPTELESDHFTMSSLPASLPVGTPKRTPPSQKGAEDSRELAAWEATDMDAFFSNQQEVRGFMNDIIVDAGLDDITAGGVTAADAQAAVFAGLTDSEKEMTIEQWVLYNAMRGEEKLRAACEQQISAFEREGQRALAMLQAIPTY